MITSCAWCFPGLQIINGEPVSHGICAKHRKKMEEDMAKLKAAHFTPREIAPGVVEIKPNVYRCNI